MSLHEKLKELVNKETKSFYCEELDMTFWSSQISTSEMIKLQEKHGNFYDTMSLNAFIDLIMIKALDKDGNKAFTLEDKPLLLRVSPNVIYSIGGGILGAQLTEDQEKN